MKSNAFIGLGSNLQNPDQQILQAVAELHDLPETLFVQRSSLYRTTPVGPQDQPEFINAVVLVETALQPLALLRQLQRIEQAHGRVRDQHWGPRTLDLDLLLYSDLTMQSPELTIPHPEMHKRAFVLVPLAEIVPYAQIPGVGMAADLIPELDVSGVQLASTGQ